MTAAIRKGFADPVFDAQRSFRAALDALARPGMPQQAGAGLAPPEGLDPAAYALALALVDGDTPVWLSPALRRGDVADSLRFHCGCPLVEAPGEAAFAFVAPPDGPALADFPIGDDRYPDRSATLVWQLPALDGGAPVALSGPGVKGAPSIAPAGLPDGFWRQWADNHAHYPLGVDVFLVAGQALIGLPRSTGVAPAAED